MAKSPLDVRLYRSSVKGRRPVPGDMAYGDLAINYNHEDPALIVKGDDNALIEFKPGSGVVVAAAAPANPKEASLWWDTTSARLFLRYGAVWVDASPAAVPPAIANALVYKGVIDPTVTASAPAAPGAGDTYVASKAGTVDASWTGFGGSSVALHELMVWDGTEWAGAGAAATPRTAWQGKVDVTAAKTAGYTAVAGDLLEVGTAGAVHADWSGVSASAVVGDIYLFDGANWRDISNGGGGGGGGVGGGNTMSFKGVIDCVTFGMAPAAPVAGDTYINTRTGSVAADWPGIAGIWVASHEILVYDGTEWASAGQPSLPKVAFRGDLDLTVHPPVLSDGSFQISNGDIVRISGSNGTIRGTMLQGIDPDAKVGELYLSSGDRWVPISTRRAWRGDVDQTGDSALGGSGIAYPKQAGDIVRLSTTAPANEGAWPGMTATAAEGELYIFDGTKWHNLGGGGGGGALPIASKTALGGVIVGNGLTVDSQGKLSASRPGGSLALHGRKDPSGPPPTAPTIGDVFVMSRAGTVAAGWAGLTGTAVDTHAVVVWDGSSYLLLGGATHGGGGSGAGAATSLDISALPPLP